MKQFNDITIIGIDQGYGNMKTANTIFPTAITAYDTAPMFKGDVLEYGGRFYRVGEGHKGFVADKSEDGDFYLLTLAAIAKELEQYRLFTANLCLAVGLPLSWVGSQRESFRQYLMQNETVSFRFNGNPFQLRIVSCKVYPQGYAAIVQQLADFDGEHLLADIGNGTMNLLYLTDSQPQENRCWTEKIGVNQCMIRAKEAVLRRFGSKISDSTVEQVLRTGTAKIDVDYLACIREVAASYAAELFAALRSYEYDPATTHLTIVGGGGQLIKHFGSYDPEQVTIVDDICAAAKVRVHGLPPDAPRVKPCRRYGRPICGSTLAKNRSGKRGSICGRWTNQCSSRTAKRLPRQWWTTLTATTRRRMTPIWKRGRARNSLCSKSWMQCGRRCRSFWQGA